MRWIMVDKMNEIDCGLKGKKWKMNNEVWTEGNEMKHEQWSLDWEKWDETWTMKCGLKEMRWNMNNEVDNVAVASLKEHVYYQPYKIS